MEDPKPKKPLNKYIRLTGAGLQMGITIYLGAYFGKWLDLKYPNDKNWFTIIFTLLALVISFYSLLKQIKDINN
ncbi:AtpZ/AtpI family protein [Namhaeicola litoreus]|uniref:AtpZ/AtpI family protein n=1 Tax=Namhaeicola litoreus TaxID=1052145 RepID=A0ABW3XXT2_9FLAO